MTALNQDLLFRTPNVYSWGEGCDVSPDGQTIAFMWNITGQWELYTLPTTGGTAQQITRGPGSKMLPCFSPDGSRLAFLQDDQGDENFDVYVLDLATGRIANLMPETPEGLNEWVRWSPDGQWLYYTSNRDTNFATFAVSSRAGSIRRVSHHAYSDVQVEPSPDGQWLAVQAMVDAQNMGIFLVPTGGGPEVRLGAEHRLADAGQPWWSPDSRKLAFSSDDRGMSDIGIYDVATRSIDWITHPDCEYYYPVWSPRGDQIAYQRLREGNVDLILHDVTGRRGPEVVQITPGVHNQQRFTPDGSTLIFTCGGAANPPDLWALQLS